MNNPNDYNRQDRYNQSILLNRQLNRQEQENRPQRPASRLQIITFINIGLIILIMLIFTALFNKTKSRNLQLGRYYAEVQVHNNEIFLSISLPANTRNNAETKEQELLGWNIFNENGELVHSQMDIPPPPNESRHFLYILPSNTKPRLQIIAGSHQKNLEL